ncbi:MAG TPA: zf-HC2 domain-containing protein [Steroidobacteraceae bacterium]|nr:zf-HC2 domain-containing protein [Steroidobacteraceae bacterium]
MSCAEALKVQAYFDAELDALSALEVERHVEGCAACRALLEDLGKARTLIRRDAGSITAGAALRSRIGHALDGENGPAAAIQRAKPSMGRSWPFWLGALSGIGTAAIAAAFAWLLVLPHAGTGLLDSLLAAHINSLFPGHLIAVQSSDRHTVKPWFAGHADVSPIVADFSEQKFPLIGGRADYFAGQRVAVTVYQHGLHVINVFSWKRNTGLPLRDTTRSGYHLAFWSLGDVQYCAVSDLNWSELTQLERLIRSSGEQDYP